jgi:hypothetical protein
MHQKEMKVRVVCHFNLLYVFVCMCDCMYFQVEMSMFFILKIGKFFRCLWEYLNSVIELYYEIKEMSQFKLYLKH